MKQPIRVLRRENKLLMEVKTWREVASGRPSSCNQQRQQRQHPVPRQQSWKTRPCCWVGLKIILSITVLAVFLITHTRLGNFNWNQHFQQLSQLLGTKTLVHIFILLLCKHKSLKITFLSEWGQNSVSNLLEQTLCFSVVLLFVQTLHILTHIAIIQGINDSKPFPFPTLSQNSSSPKTWPVLILAQLKWRNLSF